MKPYGYMVANHNAPWGYEKRWGKRMHENDLKSQRARQSRETEFLVFEALGNSDPNNPCCWGDCERCFPGNGNVVLKGARP